MNKNSVDKEILLTNILNIIGEAKKKKIFTSGDYIFVEAKKLQPELTIWVSSKMISNLIKKGILTKVKKGNKFEYTVVEQNSEVSNRDKYIYIIKKCHQIEKSALQLMKAENDGVKDLSDVVDELNKVVNKLS